MDTLLLEATNLHKSYNQLAVLKGIDLTIGHKEVISIVGASGAGKSTLLHLLGTLDSPDEGTVKLLGQDVTKLKPNQLAQFRNQHLGFIFQFHNLLAEFTALENVCLPGYLGGKAEKDVQMRAMELLDMLGLSSRAHHKPSAPSSIRRT